MTLTNVQKMSPEAKRIALAKLDGWTEIRVRGSGNCGDECILGGICPGFEWMDIRELHDYLSDLNAVHRLEEKLDELAYRRFVDTLRWTLKEGEFTQRATAAQRCDALLAVLLPDEGGEG